MGQFVRFMRFCNRRWVKWPTVIVFLTAITVAHFVMADKYGDSPNAPTWEFTITLHAAMLVPAEQRNDIPPIHGQTALFMSLHIPLDTQRLRAVALIANVLPTMHVG